MRIGLCTTDLPYALPVRELFSRIAAMGFETVQLGFGSVAECNFSASAHIEIPQSISDDVLNAIRRASREFHLPIGAINGTWNMAHPDQEVREEALRRMEGFLSAVAALECPIATLCSGTRSREHLWHEDAGNNGFSAWRDMLDSMQRAARMAEHCDVTLAIETEAANIIDTPEKARRIMDEVGSDRLKMILDCANLFHAGEAYPENVHSTIDRAIQFFGRDIVLAHGKDIQASDGIRFCGTGFGIVDFPYMIESLKKVNFSGDMMLHGIAREEDIPGCLRFMQKCMA